MKDDECGAVGGMRIGRGNRNTRKEPARATFSNTNPTLPDLGSKPGSRGGNPVTNRLSYGTAYLSIGLFMCPSLYKLVLGNTDNTNKFLCIMFEFLTGE
jgi:hypothetical protein